MFTGKYIDDLPTVKLSIMKVGDRSSLFYVLYNPTEYSLSRQVKYSNEAGMDTNTPSVQFISGTSEILQLQLFFDTMSSGAEAGGNSTEHNSLDENSRKVSLEKTDVRAYTSKVYNLMLIDPSKHVPPLLEIKWSSLQFTGHLTSVNQKFVRFNENGTPVRAVLDVEFTEYVKPSEISEMSPAESPDTTKYRVAADGDSLWATAAREYGQCSRWREIARASGVENPRLLDTGMLLTVPALGD